MRLLICLLFLANLASAQFGQKDSAIRLPLIAINFSGQLPMGDLAERFGPSFSIGGAFMYKFASNWVASVDAAYLFGSNVKEDVLEQLTNPDGFVTDNEGYPANLRITQRGLSFHLSGGRLFPVFHSNQNSGILLMLGAGYLQHKVHIYDVQQRVASVNGDLKKGYDRLSAGLSLTQFVGYLYMSRNRLGNFYGGFEAFEAFTQSKRKVNYSTGLPDTAPRLDILMGIRVGWILPLYKKMPDEFYTY